MSTDRLSKNKLSAAAALIPILIILLPLFYSFFSYVFAQDVQEAQPFLTMPAEEYKNCVQDTEFMRHNHWVLLRSVREDVVRHGIRGEISLKRCRDCHTSRVQFCDKCHNAVSMTPGCFGCHYYP